MLVLTRKVGESVVCGKGLLTVRVKKIAGNKVQLIFDAPREMPINRGEVELRIKTEDRTDAA